MALSSRNSNATFRDIKRRHVQHVAMSETVRSVGADITLPAGTLARPIPVSIHAQWVIGVNSGFARGSGTRGEW